MLHGVEAADVRSVHRARVASRRLRELLPVLQGDAATCRRIGRRLRRVTRRLGALRELDVLLLLVDELHDAGRFAERALGTVAGEIRLERAAAQKELVGKPVVAELHRIGRKLETLADDLKSAEAEHPRARGWRWAIDARVARRAATLKKAIDVAGALYLPERLHAVRIALKKLRYAAEVAIEATGIDRRADLRALKRGQDLLGQLHDFQVLIDRVRRAQASLEPPDLGVWREFDALMIALEESCRRFHARYVRERVGLEAVCGRMAGRATRPLRQAVG